MVNAPSHTTNAAIKMVTIFNSSGEQLTVSRLNAIDLIRGGDYYWKAEDIGKRPERDGPADPTAKVQTIYNEDGEKFEVTAANARDMVETGSYFWNSPTDVVTSDESETTVKEPDAEVPSEKPDTAPKDETYVVPSEESLSEQAMRVIGKQDVITYLEGFSEQALRDMAMERYGEKLHHRASKDTLITKIIAQEDARTAGDDQVDA